ncbi:MAG TPA: metal ABC transporter permease [Thermaerobacter sp.]
MSPDAILAVFVEPLRYPFMLRALLAGTLVGIAGAVIGSFLLVRRWSLLGDAISHAVLPGVALSYLLGWPYFTGALVTAILTALGIGFLERNTRLKSDAAMGLLFIGAFAAGLAILSRARSSVDVFHILFGNVLGVSTADLTLIAAVTVLVVGLVVALFKELQLWAFDPLTAEVAGLPVRLLHYLLMFLLSATIVAALQAVGIVLALAMLITPPATAYLLTRRFASMIALAAAFGVVSALTGLYLSFYLNIASGPAMVLVATAAFVVALVAAPEQGLLARWLERRRVARAVVADDVLKALDELGGAGGPVTVAAVAETTGFDARSVRRAARTLVAAGLARLARGDGGEEAITLTGEGVRRARGLIRAHRLWERYLTDVAGMPWEAVHDVAHRLEHGTPPQLAEEMAEALGHPTRDPHGAPIPTPGGEVPNGRAAVPLGDVPVGGVAEIARVDDEDPALLEELRAAGLLPGTRIRVVGRDAAGIRLRPEGQDTAPHESRTVALDRAGRIRVLLEEATEPRTPEPPPDPEQPAEPGPRKVQDAPGHSERPGAPEQPGEPEEGTS